MGKERKPSGMDFGVRVGVVVERNGALILVRHEKPGRAPYWVLPGGRLEPDETIPECAAREIMEETGLTGRFTEVLYVSEFLREGRHTVDVTARFEVDREAEATLGSDPEVQEGSEPTLKELRWVKIEDLAKIGLLPSWVRDRLYEDAKTGWPAGDVYLRGEGS